MGESLVRNSRRRVVAIAGLTGMLCLGLLPGEPRPAHPLPGDTLGAQIEEIRAKWRSQPASGESEMLALADKCTSPEEKGQAFLAMAHMFAGGGRQDVPKMGQYAERGLQYPQAPRGTSELHGMCAYAIELAIADGKAGAADQARRLAGRHYLQDYAALMHGLGDPVPDDVRRDLRVVKQQPLNPTPQEQAEFDRQSNERFALMRKAQEEDVLRLWCPDRVRNIVTCFCKFPDGAAELREAAKGVIEDQAYGR